MQDWRRPAEGGAQDERWRGEERLWQEDWRRLQELLWHGERMRQDELRRYNDSRFNEDRRRQDGRGWQEGFPRAEERGRHEGRQRIDHRCRYDDRPRDVERYRNDERWRPAGRSMERRSRVDERGLAEERSRQGARGWAEDRTEPNCDRSKRSRTQESWKSPERRQVDKGELSEKSSRANVEVTTCTDQTAGTRRGSCLAPVEAQSDASTAPRDRSKCAEKPASRLANLSRPHTNQIVPKDTQPLKAQISNVESQEKKENSDEVHVSGVETLESELESETLCTQDMEEHCNQNSDRMEMSGETLNVLESAGTKEQPQLPSQAEETEVSEDKGPGCEMILEGAKSNTPVNPPTMKALHAEGSKFDGSGTEELTAEKPQMPTGIKNRGEEKAKQDFGKKPRRVRLAEICYGIGISLAPAYPRVNDCCYIDSIHPSGPAQKSGLIRQGDKLLRVDSFSCMGICRDEIKKLVVGPYGTPVNLQLERSGSAECDKVAYSLILKRTQPLQLAVRTAKGNQKMEPGGDELREEGKKRKPLIEQVKEGERQMAPAQAETRSRSRLHQGPTREDYVESYPLMKCSKEVRSDDKPNSRHRSDKNKRSRLDDFIHTASTISSTIDCVPHGKAGAQSISSPPSHKKSPRGRGSISPRPSNSSRDLRDNRELSRLSFAPFARKRFQFRGCRFPLCPCHAPDKFYKVWGRSKHSASTGDDLSSPLRGVMCECCERRRQNLWWRVDEKLAEVTEKFSMDLKTLCQWIVKNESLLDPVDVANLFCEFWFLASQAKDSARAGDVQKAVAVLSLCAEKHAKEFTFLEISQVISSSQRSKFQGWAGLLPTLNERAVREVVNAPAKAILDLLFGFAETKENPGAVLMQGIKHRICNLLSSLSPSELCEVVFDFVRLDCHPGSVILQSMEKLLKERRQQFSYAEICSLFLCLCKINIDVHHNILDEIECWAIQSFGALSSFQFASLMYAISAYRNALGRESLLCLKRKIVQQTEDVSGRCVRIALWIVCNVDSEMHVEFFEDLQHLIHKKAVKLSREDIVDIFVSLKALPRCPSDSFIGSLEDKVLEFEETFSLHDWLSVLSCYEVMPIRPCDRMLVACRNKIARDLTCANVNLLARLLFGLTSFDFPLSPEAQHVLEKRAIADAACEAESLSMVFFSSAKFGFLPDGEMIRELEEKLVCRMEECNAKTVLNSILAMAAFQGKFDQIFLDKLVAQVRRHLMKFDFYEICSIICCLSQMGLEASADIVEALSSSSVALHGENNAHLLCQVCSALAKSETRPDSAGWLKMKEEILQSLPFFDPQQTASIFSSLSQLDTQDSGFLAKIESFVASRMDMFDTESRCVIFNALADLQHDSPSTLFASIGTLLASEKLCEGLSPKEVSRMFASLAKTEFIPHASLFEELRTAASKCSSRLDALDVSNILWAHATFGRDPGNILIAALSLQVSALLPEFKSEEVAVVAWSISVLYHCNNVIKMLFSPISSCVSRLFSSFTFAERCQLHLFFITCSLSPELQSELCPEAKQISAVHGERLKMDFVRFNTKMLKSNGVLSQLVQALDEMGMFVQQHAICQQTGYIIDLFVESKDKSWLIQYHSDKTDGTGNVLARRERPQIGECKLKNHLLSCLGYKIAAITNSEWDDVKSSKKSIRSYLAWKLGLV
eukprot:751317-Hanusia_phi.AAC.3